MHTQEVINTFRLHKQSHIHKHSCRYNRLFLQSHVTVRYNAQQPCMAGRPTNIKQLATSTHTHNGNYTQTNKYLYNKQSNRQEKQASRQMSNTPGNQLTNQQTNKQTHKQPNKPTNKQANKQPNTHAHACMYTPIHVNQCLTNTGINSKQRNLTYNCQHNVNKQ